MKLSTFWIRYHRTNADVLYKLPSDFFLSLAKRVHRKTSLHRSDAGLLPKRNGVSGVQPHDGESLALGGSCATDKSLQETQVSFHESVRYQYGTGSATLLLLYSQKQGEWTFTRAHDTHSDILKIQTTKVLFDGYMDHWKRYHTGSEQEGHDIPNQCVSNMPEREIRYPQGSP